MKRIGTLLVLFCVLSSSAVMADKDKKVSTKFGESPDDIPCKCIFNQNRMWNPERIIWHNEEWECKEYKEDGTCAEVHKVEGGIVE
jgi:hypothetical protein